MTGRSTATSSESARNSEAATSSSTRSKPFTASATATRRPDSEQPARPEGARGAASDAQAVARRHRRWAVSPLLKHILLVNIVPLVLLLAALLYLDQYQSGLLQAEVQALRQQARIFAGALGESAVKDVTPNQPALVPSLARPLLTRLTAPTP
ncbi:MAG: sensor N-terminal transmembrane domain-containing protein, partial [Rhodospirillales bacterium]|nr:sensor N-terminal transmembrane domain-containing protein [Rhodospirillales bacterium]